MTYIREKYPDLIPLYEEIYNKKGLEYWQALEQDISNYAKEQGIPVSYKRSAIRTLGKRQT